MDKSNYVILIIVVLTLFTFCYFFNAQENFDENECHSQSQVGTCLQNTKCAWCYGARVRCIPLSERLPSQECLLPRHNSS